ncbi:FtsX-like permease family protein [Larkinella rosea]|uniref:FtsX-like permease family protein n=1 Tax=Larkinella rosea TaxID=2025312 RepID=A0A3P1BG30_9BACT|nr:FtsX-like permease family protein [Larkinella rosea]RRB00015.1 FtsX-like permease family protein [Larkinella rosea]
MKPPRWLSALLSCFGDPNTLEEVQGDLLELYAYWVETVGERKARWRYGWSAIKLMRPLTRRKPSDYSSPFLLSPDMIRNYLKIALRNLAKNKAYSFINIGGLAVGMAVAILNGLWIYDELSFNTYHQNYDRIAQVTELGVTKEKRPYLQTSLPYPVATELKTSYSTYFKHILIAQQPSDYILASGDTKLTQKGQFIEAGAPEMLSLKMRSGTWAGLNDPHSVLLSVSAARALFGNTDPIDKFVKINTEMDAKVTGVFEDLPHNTAFHEIRFFAPFDLYTSVNTWVKQQQWDNWFLFVYAQIQPNTDYAQVSDRIKDIELNALRKLEGKQEQIDRKPQISLLPMSRWHLHGSYHADDRGPVQMVWLIGLIGVFVLLLACINFMNLSTARSEKRAKEVGIRKSVGSQRAQLVSQFFSESFLVVLLAFSLALLLTTLSLPWFNDIAAKQLSVPWANPYFWLASLGFTLLTGFVAGSYPALYLSSFQPVKVLKGVVRVGRFASVPRKVLVVIQFTVSVTLIISTSIVYRQLQHAKNRPIGYNRNGLLQIQKKTAEFSGKFDVLRTELKNTGAVVEVAESRSSVANITMWNGGFSRKGKEILCPNGCGTLSVTPEYGKTVGWEFMAGRDFDRGFSTDSSGLVVNESFAKMIGLKNPVGEALAWNPGWRNTKYFNVLGVVKDMVAMSPYEQTVPTVFFLENYHNWINIRINPAMSPAEALPKIEAVFKKIIPSAPFDYQFADQEYALKFAAEERIGKLAGVFAGLAIFISCLGLFGLASFMAEQRTKEIGVRKVLGASVLNLWGLLSKDFVLLVLIGFGIATPIAYYSLSDWLQNYQYRTEISWWIFAASGAGALAITLLTVSFQSIKAALVNPVKSLRSE